jgi:hypothetical protein
MIGGYMHSMLMGFLSGAVSGVAMGIVSDLLFRLGLFKSSLIMIDGSFLFRTLRSRPTLPVVAGAGLCIHVVTSGVFGALYFPASSILGLEADFVRSFTAVGLYVVILWLAMLFIALPVAGEGILGRKSGSLSWLEQLILHAIYCILYYECLGLLL